VVRYSELPTELRWPDGITQARFLKEFWQKKPLLLRQAIPDFDTPLPADELAGLSLEPDTTPRLITQDSDGCFHLEHGPFDESRFATLSDDNWSLLVTDVEKHLPDLRDYLTPFQFLPTWRIDDLMISYAPVGASVGAHVDEYDVFLLQASGKRRWLIDRDTQSPHSSIAQGDLKLVENFQATDEWELEPGDILYLPPGVAHHGIASEEACTTWSIGFRAPAFRDSVMRIAEMIAEALPLQRYRDGDLNTAIPGEITAEAIQRFKTEWLNATQLENPAFTELIGRLLTEAGVAQSSSDDPQTFMPGDDGGIRVHKAPFSRMAWHQCDADESSRVLLFVDGSVHVCSRTLAIKLCGGCALNITETATLRENDRALLKLLHEQGCLVERHEPQDQ